MGIRSAIAKAAAKMGFYPLPQGVAFGSGSWYWSGWSDLGYPANQVKAYQGWVSSCVNLIAQDMARLPRKLYKQQGQTQDDWREVYQHPLLDLLDRPNPLMTGTQMLILRQMHLDLTGMAFWRVVGNSLGRPAELWPLLPHMLVKIETPANDPGRIEGFRFRDDQGKEYVYPWDEVLYFRNPHPTSLLYGASIIQQQALAYDTDEALRKYQRSFFANSARPDFVLSSDANVTEDTAKRILTVWKQKHQGPDNAGEPAILSNGLKPVQLSFSAKDFEFMALAGWTRDNILAAFGVPAAKLGLVEDVNRANGSETDVTYRRDCIGPRANAASESVTYQLAKRYDPKLWLDFENEVPQDEAGNHSRRMAELDHGVVTINEWRSAEGLDPVEGGDVPRLPANIVPITLGISLGDIGAPPEEQLALPAPVVKGPELSSLEFIAKVTPWEARMKGLLRPVFGRQGLAVQERLAALWPRLEGEVAGWSKAKVAVHMKAKDRLAGLFETWDNDAADLTRVWQAIMPALAQEAGSAALAQAEVGIIFNVADPVVVDWLGTHAATAAKVNDYTRTRIRDALSEALSNGETFDQAKTRVSSIFDWCQNSRAGTIARTEIANAQRWAYDEGLQQSGMAFLKSWVNEPGARPTHGSAGIRYTKANAIPMGSSFVVGGCSGPLPGHTGCAAQDINCRCHVIYIPDTGEKAARRQRQRVESVPRAYSLEDISCN